MSMIVDIHGRQILDSRGNPTVEVDVTLDDNTVGTAAVPSGASTGIHEAWELRDGDKAVYLGKGVAKAVTNINEVLANELVGLDAMDQIAIDQRMLELDGTPNKKNLGANAILGVSLATAHAAARYCELPLYKYVGGSNARLLPAPMMNIVNGGQHADNSVDVQEFMVMPLGFERFSDALRCGCEIFHHLKSVLKGQKLNTAVGDEGGFAPDLPNNAAAIDLILEAIEKAGYQAGKQVWIAMDVAATEILRRENQEIHDRRQGDRRRRDGRSPRQLGREVPHLLDRRRLQRRRLGRLEAAHRTARRTKCNSWATTCSSPTPSGSHRGIKAGVANSILIKVNQIGTLTETIEAVRLAARSGYTNVMSHRSGETEDATIADLAVALGTGQIKTGSASRSDRMAKYNQLLRIEEQLGNAAQYGGPLFPKR